MAQTVLTSKRFWTVFGVIGAAIWLICYKPSTFSLSRISSNLPHRPEWEITPSDADQKQMRSILGQNYRYLASGTQVYAFLSDDGKYVIKFFRMKHLLPSLGDYFRSRIGRRKANLETIFGAYKLAYDTLRQETGLLFIHLNKTDYLKTTITITDRLGKNHTIDLDRFEFVVQEKAELFSTHLQKLNCEGAKKAVGTVLALVRRRIEKGVTDDDKAVIHNYGFIGDRPIQLDIGRICRGIKTGEYERIEARMERWLQENFSTSS